MDDSRHFENQRIDGAAFHNCSAIGTVFDHTNLSQSGFVNVNLRGSKFQNVDLSGVAIDDANIDGLRIGGHDIQALIRAELRRLRSQGHVSFLEIGSSDADATRKFFNAVFDWPCHDNAWLQTPDLKAGTHGNDPSPQIYVYFSVPDIDAVAARVQAAGGTADHPISEPGFGRFVNCRDPGGIRFGLHGAE